MAIIPQRHLFGWNDIAELGDLERLRLVVSYLPDEELMVEMEKERGNGRNDYPVRAVWNSVLAGVVFQHPSIESLRRELLRNGQLRQVCGFNLLLGAEGVPPAWAYTRFLRHLLQHEKGIEKMFHDLVEEVCRELPEFGRNLAIDGKALQSLAGHYSDNRKTDGRRDVDGDFGKKVYRGKRQDGSVWEKVVIWFGYRLHLIVDATYELPVGYTVTKAARSEIKEAHALVDSIGKNTPTVRARAEYMSGDKGYDDTEFLKKLYDEYQIKPVIDIRNMWKDGEATKLVPGQENVVYNYQGKVYCVCPKTLKLREMAYGGHEKARGMLKYRCPALQYGIACPGRESCPIASAIRISLATDRRVFTPLARSSYKWETIYKTRTSVERVNSRLDESFGFEKHFIRGLTKMQVRCGLALIVMLAMALGRIREKRGNPRSLVAAA